MRIVDTSKQLFAILLPLYIDWYFEYSVLTHLYSCKVKHSAAYKVKLVQLVYKRPSTFKRVFAFTAHTPLCMPTWTVNLVFATIYANIGSVQVPSPNVYRGVHADSSNPARDYALEIKKAVDDIASQNRKVGADVKYS